MNKWLQSLESTWKKQKKLLEKQRQEKAASNTSSKWKGIRNLGATCYISSILQMWFHTTNFKKQILSTREENEITRLLKRIMLEMEFSNASSIDISALVQLLQIDPSIQQDASEYFVCCINFFWVVHSRFYRLLARFIDFEHGTSCYSTKCLTCQNTRSNPQPFTQLELNISGKSMTLEESISSFFSEEELEDLYNCINCGPSKAVRFADIQKYPNVLCLQILRFKTAFEKSHFVKRKSSCLLQFPPIIDFSAKNGHVYELHGVLVHHGEIDHGHYIPNMKTTDGWIQFDDAVPYKLHMDCRNIFDLVHNIGKKTELESSFTSRNVYMLIYVKKEPEKIKGSREDPCTLSDDESNEVNQEIFGDVKAIYDEILNDNEKRKDDIEKEILEVEVQEKLETESIEVHRKIIEFLKHNSILESIDIDESPQPSWQIIPLKAITDALHNFTTSLDIRKHDFTCPHGKLKQSKLVAVLPPEICDLLNFLENPFTLADECAECQNAKTDHEHESSKHMEHVQFLKNLCLIVDEEEGWISKRWLQEWLKKKPAFDKYLPSIISNANPEVYENGALESWKVGPDSYPFIHDVLCCHGGRNPDSLARKLPMPALLFLRTIYPDFKIVTDMKNCDLCDRKMKLHSYFDKFRGNTDSDMNPMYLRPKFESAEFMIPYEDGRIGCGSLRCEHGLLSVNPTEYQITAYKLTNPGYIIINETELKKMQEFGYEGEFHEYVVDEDYCEECNFTRRTEEVKVSVECKGQTNKRRKKEIVLDVLRSEKLSILKMKIAQMLSTSAINFSLYVNEKCIDDHDTCHCLIDGIIITCKMLDTFDEIDDEEVQEVGFKGTLLIQ